MTGPLTELIAAVNACLRSRRYLLMPSSGEDWQRGSWPSVLRQGENSQLELNVCRVESKVPSHSDPGGHL